ncbi:hypothetical protein OF829_08425 [Sphingomonas sp. LB-2]|uniref:hypothetical protein n=1 Tax=Sphingomonas caeni TaxID=2984949 RepID=UPI00223045F3|nr:hypothetical protein [Sphingomonas caeni]MCW3847265.1 hypothetical protein [Sphingomonas caeni]
MGAWLAALIALAIVASIPWLVRWGKRNARGSLGGAAMMLGLAFGHLFDPARATATEALLKKRESGVEEDQAGERHRPDMQP